MYHRFNENKYPSTNIRMDVFVEQMKIIKKNSERKEEHNSIMWTLLKL